MKRLMGAALAAWCLIGAVAQAEAQTTLEKVKARGELACGTSQGVPGFSLPDATGKWKGFDTDFCRALSAAIFNDPDKVRYVSLSSKDRLIALQSGEVDVLPRTTTWTLARDSGQGVIFAAVNYYDGQGFLVRKSTKVGSVKELDGASVCVAQGTTNELNLGDYARTNNLHFKPVTFQAIDDVTQAYETGRCDALSTDMSQLAALRLKMAQPGDHVILPEAISKEPLGPWVRKGDETWLTLVRWTLFAWLDAEELGVTQANLDAMLRSENPEIRRLLGAEGNLGETIGLSKDWVARIVRHVGNYGESFDRNLGAGSPVGLPRSLNRLWSQGGIQYAPSIR
ncbi:amino acid ABC transporter substrate-binding protein [Alsobacter soli]|uniref:Amino acid ABC transporter substrate-binding protein n=1 Tax=Alsobacter soli TaxID=2109933 RepID=A0A2T1HY60_9HYPH|nr:amino acid ABC transporter substrate-binding protein [Alsobacter soli]PSC06601.1 amino acid ABC transporter substrate-binding protein [Alsobacter soli]